MRLSHQWYPTVRRPWAGLCLLSTLLLAPGTISAQSNSRVRFEVGAGLGAEHFAPATHLKNGFATGGWVGVWLPAHFGIEAEGIFASPKTTADLSWKSRTITGSVLYTVPVGTRNGIFFRAGYGSMNFSGDACDLPSSLPGVGPCGDAGVLIGGMGLRVALSQTVMIRGEGQIQRTSTPKLNNLAGLVGVSIVLGGKPPVDSDGDGVFDHDDRCLGTGVGVRVDQHGCPLDSDHDGVTDNLDKCSGTPTGAKIDASGCPVDSDRDGVADGLDRCSDTPEGALVNAEGCPSDRDHDTVLDGLDRCPDTPAGATVDALGCPGDEDGDSVLDGIDQCPRTPAGVSVDARGCPAAEERRAAPPAAAPPTGRGDSAAGAVLRGVNFRSGSAQLEPASSAVLDSVARVLQANARLTVEIAGFTDNTGPADFNRHLSQLRADAVRNYLISRGVPGNRMQARGFGAAQPIASNATAAGRARNRRIEIRPIGPP
ncbi:MAG TPA: OmpA family protein [Gemmatimonadales bacterium]|nr:OmpA family protein [Gemmatimonadales bacterium]